MTTGLARWLEQATHCLSSDSAARVRAEVRDHYESEREAAVSRGAAAEAADWAALAALGEAKTANRQYRKVLLTATEAKILVEIQWEARAVCSRPSLVRMLRLMPIVAMCSAAVAFVTGPLWMVRLLLFAGVVVGTFVAVPTLPIYTLRRARVYRYMKWVLLAVATAVLFGPNAANWAGALFICCSGFCWTEWTLHSIRRKLPVAKWPRALYL